MKQMKRSLPESVRDALYRATFNYMQRVGGLLCVAPTTIASNTGATLWISATLPPVYTSVGYSDSNVIFTQIGDIEDHGSHGMTANVMKFVPVATGVVAKRKGSKDYGTMQLKLGNVPGDAGQVILRAASESPNPYSIKLTYPSGEIHFLEALVSSFTNDDGPADNIQHLSVALEITRAPVIVSA